MTIPKQGLYTTDCIDSLPEGKRAELIDGEIFAITAPDRIHQRLNMYLSAAIYDHIRHRGLPCEVYAAPFAVYLTDDKRNYVEPDISVICDGSKLSDRGCEGAPDWIVEIVSSSSSRMDYLIKLLKYRSAGVRLYWIIDPDIKAILCYDFQSNSMQRYTFLDVVSVSICDGFSLSLSDFA